MLAVITRLQMTGTFALFPGNENFFSPEFVFKILFEKDFSCNSFTF